MLILTATDAFAICRRQTVNISICFAYNEPKHIPFCFISILDGRVLQIPMSRVEHAGKYTCEASNEAGEDRLHYDLIVLSE